MVEPLWKPGALFAGKYCVEAVLGRGGMGIVLGARHTRLDEPVAIKVLLPEMMDTPGVVERFLREARAAAKIKSQHVARVTDVDTLPSGLPFIVMERLEGMDLAALCRQQEPLEIEAAVRYVVEACDAVAEAHARGIVHRDIKPGNLFLAEKPDGSCTIKVLDFGISKLPSDSGEHVVTAAGATLGSPSYMSPEQMRSARDVDARTDIWALGAVLYRLLTGRTPFRADTIPDLYTLVASATLQRPSELRADIPPELDDVLIRCLEKDPARRYESVTALAAALLPFAGDGARLPVAPMSTRALPLSEQKDEPASGPRGPSSGPRSVEQEPAGGDSVSTAAEARAGFETSASAPLVTSAVRARGAADSTDGAMPRKPLRGKRRAVLAAAVLLVASALVAAGLGIRFVRRDADLTAAGAVASTTAATPPAPVGSVTATSTIATSPPSQNRGTSEPIVSPAMTVVASAAAPQKRLPRRNVVEKKSPPPGVVPDDPFGGARK